MLPCIGSPGTRFPPISICWSNAGREIFRQGTGLRLAKSFEAGRRSNGGSLSNATGLTITTCR